MTHPASIFPISAMAVSAILLLGRCSDVPNAGEQPVSGDERLVTKSVVALVAEVTTDEVPAEGTVGLK